MLHAPIILLALAGTSGECDRRATIAGTLMILHQSGAGAAAISAAAQATAMPAFASTLVPRIVSAETSADAPARELAAFHFAAEIHAECSEADARTS